MRRSSALTTSTLGVLALVAGCGADTAAIVTVQGATDSSTLVLSADSCDQDPVADVMETETEIRIEVTVGGSSQDDCLDGLEVDLGGRVGDRKIIDESTGKSLELKAPFPG